MIACLKDIFHTDIYRVVIKSPITNNISASGSIAIRLSAIDLDKPAAAFLLGLLAFSPPLLEGQ